MSHTVIDEYIETFAPEIAGRLRDLRAAIKAALPEADEAISYRIPAFRVADRDLIYLAGWKKHVALYPVPAGPPELLAALEPWHASKGTLRFPHTLPLPLDLIPAVVAARLAEHKQPQSGRPAPLA